MTKVLHPALNEEPDDQGDDQDNANNTKGDILEVIEPEGLIKGAAAVTAEAPFLYENTFTGRAWTHG